jgi:hypothetical protein
MIKKIGLFFIALLVSASAFAADYYVTQTGAGLKDGSDWDNALDAFQYLLAIDTTAAAYDIFYVYSDVTVVITANVTWNAAYVTTIGIADKDNMTYAYGDDRPLVAAGVYAWICNTGGVQKNIRFTTANTAGVSVSSFAKLYNCKVLQSLASRDGYNLSTYASLYGCYAENLGGKDTSGYGFSAGSATAGSVVGCVAKGFGYGFSSADSFNSFNLAWDCIGGFLGHRGNGSYLTAYECDTGIIWNATRLGSAFGLNLVDCGIGINFSGGGATYGKMAYLLENSNFYNCPIKTTDDGLTEDLGFLNLVTYYELDPQFTDAASGDFSVGENLKELGFPVEIFAGDFPNGFGLSMGAVAMGATQREESGGGGGGETVNVCEDSAFYGAAFDTIS